MSYKTKTASPFLLVCAIMLYSWGEILFTEYAATWRQWLALVLVAGNAVLYFLRYRQAVWLTGLILTLATFNLLSFFAVTYTWGISIGGINTPEVQPWTLLILVLYGFLNFDTLVEWYLDWTEDDDVLEKNEEL